MRALAAGTCLCSISLPLSDDLRALDIIWVGRTPAMTQVVVAVAGAGADITWQA
jgi:hypothetical protein